MDIKELLDAANVLKTNCENNISCKKCIFVNMNGSGFSDCFLSTTPSHYALNIVRHKCEDLEKKEQ